MRTLQRTSFIGFLLGCILGAWGPPAQATSVEQQDLTDLIRHSESIVAGRVIGLTDGFENGVPYTEVTVEVDETLRGRPGRTHTFRQFGLLAPRDLGNGRTYLGVSP
jgi:hypothetical protein